MSEQLENSLRIKVTGKCNRNCFFCHQEGDMGSICDIGFSEELQYLVSELNKEFSIDSIAITGGEPLIYDGLLDLVRNIFQSTPIKKFSLTTNGSIHKDLTFWTEFKRLGLYKVNVSISDVLDYIPVTDDKNSNSKMFQNQLSLITDLSAMGIKTNVNVVVYNDKKHLLNVLNAIFSSKDINNKIRIALLPDLTNTHTFNRSQTVISEILDCLGCKQIKLSRRKGTSNTICDYVTAEGFNLQVKTTKPHGTPKWLDSLCTSCERKDECQEGFYGLRLEKRNEKLYLRMCLYKSSDDVLMTLDEFLESPVFVELKQMWN